MVFGSQRTQLVMGPTGISNILRLALLSLKGPVIITKLEAKYNKKINGAFDRASDTETDNI